MLCLQVFILQCTYENSWPRSMGFVCMLSDSMKLILVMELFIKLMASIIYLVCVYVCGVIMSYSIEFTCPYCTCTVHGDIVINVDESIEQHNIDCIKKYDQKLTDYENKTKGQDKIKESFNLKCEIHNKKWWVILAFWNKRKVIFENNQIKIVDYYNEKKVHLQKHYLQWFLSCTATYISHPYKYILCPVCDGRTWVKK